MDRFARRGRRPSWELRAGTRIAHCAWNRGDRDCLLLVVAARSDADRVFYPEDPEFDAYVAERRPDRWWKA
jgi:uncharacterized cupin superfamily protein